MTTATATKAAAKPAETTTPQVSEATQALANVFAKSMTIEKDGTVKIEGDLIGDNLPAELDIATIKRVQKHRSEVLAAAALALGEKGLPYLKKNKDADGVELTFKIGADKVGLNLERSREFNDGKGGKILKQGYIAMSYTASGAGNSGELKKARQRVGDEAAALFG